MKRVLILIVLALVTSSLTFGQGDKERPNRQNARVETELRQIEQECSDALVKGDAVVFERYTAPDCILTNPDGSIWDTKTLLDVLKSGDLKYESSKIDQMKVQVYGNAAVVTYRPLDKGTLKGQDISSQNRWTDTFVKLNGRWQCVATQGTHIAQP